jgi:HemX protein
MSETLLARLYELMIIIYACSLCLYSFDYLKKNIRIRRAAFWLISIVWAMQTTFIAFFIIEHKRFPILSLFEGVFFYGWLLISISIILHCIAKVDLPVVFMNVLGFIFVTIYLFGANATNTSTGDTIVSEMLIIHISLSILSYAMFTLAFVFSVLYLILYNLLKKKKLTAIWSRLPNLGQTSNWIGNSILIGVPLLLISLLLGLEWAWITLDQVSLFDIKILGSFILALVYLGIILLHRSGKLVGTNYAWANIYVFLALVINFFLGNSLSEFHLWV